MNGWDARNERIGNMVLEVVARRRELASDVGDVL